VDMTRFDFTLIGMCINDISTSRHFWNRLGSAPIVIVAVLTVEDMGKELEGRHKRRDLRTVSVCLSVCLS
jgi:hypothetical protein